MSALLLHASVAVGIPLGSKYSCSPRAIATNLPRHTRPHSRDTIRGVTCVSPRGARPHPPGPKAALSVRRYLISGRYSRPSANQLEHPTRLGQLTRLDLHISRCKRLQQRICDFLVERTLAQSSERCAPVESPASGLARDSGGGLARRADT